ncbi:MAG: FtsQ-type POTRA domain-containing protein [Deltaproteobacteria bacterium]|nr:FtsQ-type POTRA domain-containing protein [Deltaproteobacteria bacterium]
MSTVSLPATLLQRWKMLGKRENQRTTPKVPTKKRWYVLALLTLLTVSVYAPHGWRVLSHYIQQHPYFAITTIDVELDAGALFSQEEIISWSGIEQGMNLWTVDPEEIRSRLLTYQGIRDVDVRREFPQRVVLQVQTRHPIAVVVSPSLTYLDKDGVSFQALAQRKELDLPYVTGFRSEELDTAAIQAALTGTVSLLAQAKQFWVEPVSEIRWDREIGYTVFLARRHLAIRLGWETGPEKFTQVATVLTRWPAEASPALLDARFLNQVVVRPFLDESGLHPVTPVNPL